MKQIFKFTHIEGTLKRNFKEADAMNKIMMIQRFSCTAKRWRHGDKRRYSEENVWIVFVSTMNYENLWGSKQHWNSLIFIVWNRPKKKKSKIKISLVNKVLQIWNDSQMILIRIITITKQTNKQKKCKNWSTIKCQKLLLELNWSICQYNL